MKQITPDIRKQLANIFKLRWEEIESLKNKITTWHESDEVSIGENHYRFDHTKCNEIYSDLHGLTMSNFWFGNQFVLDIHNILGIEYPVSNIVIGIRVHPGMTVPMHLDPIDDKFSRLSILVSGADGIVFAGIHGSSAPLFSILGIHDFIINASKIPHGAKAGKEPIDIIQLEIDEND